jgi:hypothetical protein
LDSNDRDTVRECVKTKAVNELHTRLTNDTTVQKKIAEKNELPTVSFEEVPAHRLRGPGGF